MPCIDGSIIREEREIKRRERAYAAGKNVAITRRKLTARNIERLRSDVDYWEGFHRNRPSGCTLLGRYTLEDPTRGGGWCYVPGTVKNARDGRGWRDANED